MHLFSYPYVLYTLPISFFLIFPLEKYLMRSIEYKAPRCG
jgi:hypothetical protein